MLGVRLWVETFQWDTAVGTAFKPVIIQLSQFVGLGFNDLDRNPVIDGDDENTLIGID